MKKITLISILIGLGAITNLYAENLKPYQVFDIVRESVFPDNWEQYCYFVSMENAEDGQYAVAVDVYPGANTPSRFNIYYLDIASNPAVLTEGKKKVPITEIGNDRQKIYDGSLKKFEDKYSIVDYILRGRYNNIWKSRHVYIKNIDGEEWSMLVGNSVSSVSGYIEYKVVLVQKEGENEYAKNVTVSNESVVDEPDLSCYECVVVPFEKDVIYDGSANLSENDCEKPVEVWTLDGIYLGMDYWHNVKRNLKGCYIVRKNNQATKIVIGEGISLLK